MGNIEIDPKYKILLSGFTEQDLPYQCPECNSEMLASDMIGFGDYPSGGYRSSLKPSHSLGVGFECPKCFLKSCFHADKYVYQLFIDTLSIKK